ncbi:hypothetical protein [Leptospira sp. P2653]|uniref:DUF6984 family protein n=1 Tax=Leptospira sp. P2653 TaxID=1218600 RepID=UPI000559CDB7|nr:hypothetical protein [Leptospira sp. P2653]
MHLSRSLKPEEKEFLLAIVDEDDGTSVGLDPLNWIPVQELSDGHMGSIRFIHDPNEKTDRQFGRIWKEVWFYDEDGVIVFAAIILDKTGLVFELEIWKTNFEPLQRYPKREEIRTITK